MRARREAGHTGRVTAHADMLRDREGLEAGLIGIVGGCAGWAAAPTGICENWVRIGCITHQFMQEMGLGQNGPRSCIHQYVCWMVCKMNQT